MMARKLFHLQPVILCFALHCDQDLHGTLENDEMDTLHFEKQQDLQIGVQGKD